MTTRPTMGAVSPDAKAVVAAFMASLQSGHDERDADILNSQFAADVVWGSPFGALVEGYEQLHPIHVRFQSAGGERPRIRYEVRHVQAVGSDLVIAHIARIILGSDGRPVPPTDARDQPFSEMAMYVLVRRGERWWLAAGQNTPMRPGGAVAAGA